MKNIYKNLIFFLSIVLFTSCSDFLDENPDQRTDINSKDKIRKLLVSAYPTAGHALITEMSTDNIVDEGEDNPNNRPVLEQLAYWNDVTFVSNDDPNNLWESSYKAIASSNLALQAIEELGGNDLQAEKAEALITRAYSYFVLVNVFAKHYNDATSGTDLGVPYIDKPEVTLNPSYERATVKEIYEKIDADIEAALPYIQDDIYEQPKYHFNKKAAYAFAARFNLYYAKWEKAKQYATKAIEISQLIDWAEISTLTNTFKIRSEALLRSSGSYLLQTDISGAGLIFGPYYYGARINHTNHIAYSETAATEMPWGTLSTGSYKVRPFSINGNKNFQKFIFPKTPYLFEYTDFVAQIGFYRTVYTLFSSDETYLVRAEANIHLLDYAGALNDLNAWADNYFVNYSDLTQADINQFYDNLDYSDPQTKMTQKKKLNPVNFTIVDKDQENMLHYLLQCRRISTLQDGLRWFDIKRYGIEVNRFKKQVGGQYTLVETLSKEDNRRAIQIPQDVISSGITPNPR